MKIHLIRHAKTTQTDQFENDIKRKLLPKGIIQANVLGNYLQSKNIQAELTWCSTANRTKETLSILHHSIDLGKIIFSSDLYLCENDTYLKKVWELKTVNELFIIGHNDGISSFASYVTNEHISLKPCEYCCIEFNIDSWDELSKGNGRTIDRFLPSVFLPD